MIVYVYDETYEAEGWFDPDLLLAGWFDNGFSESGGTSPTGQIKVYAGSFAAKPVKVWNGTSWETKPVKYWNGSSWETTTY